MVEKDLVRILLKDLKKTLIIIIMKMIIQKVKMKSRMTHKIMFLRNYFQKKQMKAMVDFNHI